MPLATFFNLPKEKRDLILSVASEEFSKYDYHAASINRICAGSGIAKGSFYQYFAGKLDLYAYVMTSAIKEKVRFFSDVREEFRHLTLLEQIRLLFRKGLEFAQAHPLFSALGDQFARETDESARAAVLREGEKLADPLFLQMIDEAKARGEIDQRVDSLALSLLLQAVNASVVRYMRDRFGDVRYARHEEDANRFLDSLLTILRDGIENRNSARRVP